MKNNGYEVSDFFTDEEFEDIHTEWCPSGWRENCEDIDLSKCDECWMRYLNKEIKKMLSKKMSFEEILTHFCDTLKSCTVANNTKKSS